MPRTWFGPQFDPAAIAKCQGKRRRDDLLAIANTRLGSSRIVSAQSSACAASNPWLAKTACSAALGCGAVASGAS
jgi:hypothetical protein